MFRNIKEAKAFLADRDDRHKYERSKFDAFLEANQFAFKVPAIHITGTNGKGTTAKALLEIYTASGRKVGMFNSPYLFYENEMWQINGVSMSDERLLELINRYAVGFLKFGITAFEMETFIAFIYFAEEEVDLAIIEVGMGGKTDATNVFTPILSIITNVTLEHTQFLGSSLKDIAINKAGILKPGIPVLIGSEMLPEPQTAIENIAERLDSPFYQAPAPLNIRLSSTRVRFDYSPNFKGLVMASPAAYNALDGMVAIEATYILAKKFPLAREHIVYGLNQTALSARMEMVKLTPRIIIDGAHNPGAFSALVNNLQLLEIEQPIVIFSAFLDKDVESEFALLTSINARVVLTHYEHPRTRRRDEYPANEFEYYQSPITAIKTVMKAAKPTDTIIITGSLGFAGYISFLWKEGVFNDEN